MISCLVNCLNSCSSKKKRCSNFIPNIQMVKILRNRSVFLLTNNHNNVNNRKVKAQEEKNKMNAIKYPKKV